MTLSSVFLLSCIFAFFNGYEAAAATGTTQKYSAPILLTYPGMTNAGVTGTIIYDVSQKTVAFNYPGLSYTEIYRWNSNLGYASSDRYSDQYVWKIAPYASCTPCAQYGNVYGFPFTNNTVWTLSGVPNLPNYGANTVGTLDTATNCRRYTPPASANSFASYFYLNEATGNLCSIADQSERLWTVTGAISSTYDASLIAQPDGCKCLKPIDIAISLDRSTSISTDSTEQYQKFVQQLATSFYFNSSDPVNTAQLSITQWGTQAWSLSSLGTLNFTTNPNNVNTASGLIGCTSASGTCDFCFTCGGCYGNSKRAMESDEEENVEDETNQRGRTPTRNPTRAPTRAPTSQVCKAEVDCCTQSQYTCTGCGIRALTESFTRVNTTYINRTAASKISIVITDGKANTKYGSPWYESCDRGSNGTNGCYRDIHVQRNNLLASVPGIVTFAIGVSSDIDSTTLNYISGSPDRSFQEDSFEDLLANLQKYVLGFCPLPDPITECGKCCGFCECGVCVPPDTPIPSKFCDNYTVSSTPNAGGCYTQIPKTDICPPRNCNTYTCNAATSSCEYTNLCAPGGTPGQLPCFTYICATSGGVARCEPDKFTCINGSSDERCACPPGATPAPTKAPTRAPTQSPTRAPTENPTAAPTAAPTPFPTGPPVPFPTPSPTEAPTTAPTSPTNAPTPPTNAPTPPTEAPTRIPCGREDHCGSNGDCNVTSPDDECICKNNFTGVTCGVPPDFDLCKTDTDCFQEQCINSVCVEGTTGGKVCNHSNKVCDDSDPCTTDRCDQNLGCVFTPINCDDGLSCTTDQCVGGTCTYTQINCSYLDDLCHGSYCNDFALTDAERCIQQAITCTAASNCSITECRKEEAGCVSEEYTCTPVYAGVVAGIAAGVIAGVVVAGAFVLCAAATAGGGYAVSKNYDHSNDGAVHVSPLYKPETKTGVGMAH